MTRGWDLATQSERPLGFNAPSLRPLKSRRGSSSGFEATRSNRISVLRQSATSWKPRALLVRLAFRTSTQVCINSIRLSHLHLISSIVSNETEMTDIRSSPLASSFVGERAHIHSFELHKGKLRRGRGWELGTITHLNCRLHFSIAFLDCIPWLHSLPEPEPEPGLVPFRGVSNARWSRRRRATARTLRRRNRLVKAFPAGLRWDGCDVMNVWMRIL